MMAPAPDSEVEAVYRAQHERLWRSLLAFTGSPELASDAEAEALAQMIGRGDEIVDLSAWLWRSAYRIAGGMLQRQRRTFGGDVDRAIVDDPPLFELFSVLGDLSKQQRACIVLRHAGRFTAAEIADLLGTTEGTVRVQLHRAHAALRLELEAT